MYLNDLNSSQHNVKKLNRILADTFKHDVDLSEMSTDSLNRMLTTTNSKMMEIKESNLKYWENPQYNKLGLIAHQIKTYLSEIAPTRSDGKKMKKESTVMEADLDQAEVLLAAQELVDELQKMVEDVAEMQVQKLMPIVDAMKEQIGFDVAEAYNNAADAALGGLLGQMKTAKEAVENATLAARGEPVPGGDAVPTDMGMSDADMDPEAPMDADANMDMPADEFGGDEAEAGEDNAVGRELKGESALADMERGALAEKKFLESKDKLFKMVESGKMTQEHFVNVVNELDRRRRRLPGVDPATGPMVPPVDSNELPQPIRDPEPAPKAPVPMDMMSPELQKRYKNKKMAPPIPIRHRQKIGDSAVKEKNVNKYGVEINPYHGKERQKMSGREPYMPGMEKKPDLKTDLPDMPSGPPQDTQGGLQPSIPKAFDDYPFNRFAPPPTGPGGDEALPTKPQPKPRRMMPRGEFRAQRRTGPMRFADVAKAKSG